MNKKIVMLGCGFAGKVIMSELERAGYEIYPTSRCLEKNEFLNDGPKRVLFDLADHSTYQNIPEGVDIIWTFPASPLEKVINFYNFTVKNNNRVRIVFGTTSAYREKQGIITENSLINNDSERVKGENFLLQNGAVVLQTAGIYGEGRHPFNWLNKGLIKNSAKTVNLIHTRDIALITVNLLEAADIVSQRFNLSDGNKYLWKDIWEKGRENGEVFVECPPELEKEDRLISNQKLMDLFGNDYTFVELLV